jgi:hypothetical protein
MFGPWVSGPAIPLEELLDELDELELDDELELLDADAGAEFLFLFPPQPIRERLISNEKRKGTRKLRNIE